MKRLFVTYFALIHLLLIGVLWKSDFLERVGKRIWKNTPTTKHEITDHFDRMLQYHARSVDVVPDEAVFFIGDSITQGLCVAAVAPLAVNYGIGSDTTTGVLQRLPVYMPALKRAKCIVIAIGVNDSAYRSVEDAILNYELILDKLPQGVCIVVSSVLPVTENNINEQADRENNAKIIPWITEFNVKLKKLTSDRERVVFVDNQEAMDGDSDGRLDARLQVGDGVHLNSVGNLLWITNLRNAVNGQCMKE